VPVFVFLYLSHKPLGFFSLELLFVLLLSPQSLSFGNVCCPHLDKLGNSFILHDVVGVHDGLPERGKDITFIIWHRFKGWVMKDMRHDSVLVSERCLETGVLFLVITVLELCLLKKVDV
jgi:hypothetical protein